MIERIKELNIEIGERFPLPWKLFKIFSLLFIVIYKST